MKEYTIRLATTVDAAGILAIYKPYVENTSVTFEYEVPPLEEYMRRVSAVIPHYPWLVCLADGEIAGYAYAHRHRERTAYQWSPESTIYLSEKYHGKGIARILYRTLFEILKLQGFVNVYASVLVTNSSSNKLHVALGFEEIGIYTNIGYKHGEWHSNRWYQLPIAAHTVNPPPPKRIEDVVNTDDFSRIMNSANEKVKHIALQTANTPL